MKNFTPKSYRVRHKTLMFLTKISTDNSKNGFASIKEISKNIKEKELDIDLQLNILWSKKLVAIKKENAENTYTASTEGISEASSMNILNDGKLLNSTIFNNISSGFFQIVVGIIAIITIYYNFNDSKTYHEEVKSLKQEIEGLTIKISERATARSTENNFNDTKANYPTNVQTDDRNSTKASHIETKIKNVVQ